MTGNYEFDLVVIGAGPAGEKGAAQAAYFGKKVAVVTQMALRDQNILEPLRQNGVAFQVIPSTETTYMKVLHPSADVDERQIYQLLAEGNSNKDIANRLTLSLHTVETHRWRIMEKMDLHSTGELVLSAVRRGMVT